MNSPLIDIGINLINRQFKNDVGAVIKNAEDAGVYRMLLTGTSVSNSEQSAALAQQYSGQLFSTAGIHPHDAKQFDGQSIDRLKALLQQPQVVSVGECGLDFDRDFHPGPCRSNVLRHNCNLQLTYISRSFCMSGPHLNAL